MQNILENEDARSHLEELVRRRRDVISVSLARASRVSVVGVLQERVEDGILERVEDVRVGRVDVATQTLALGTLRLHVVLPEAALLRLVAARQDLGHETRAAADRL